MSTTYLHPSAIDRIQADAAEHQRWQGRGLVAQRGCNLLQVCLDAATVTVEYEFTPSGGDDWNEPRYDAEACVISVLINGALIPVEGFIDPAQIERWEQAILESESELVHEERESDAVQAMLDRIMDGQEIAA